MRQQFGIAGKSPSYMAPPIIGMGFPFAKYDSRHMINASFIENFMQFSDKVTYSKEATTVVLIVVFS